MAGDEPLPDHPVGRVRELHGASGDYLRELELRFRDLDLSGTRVLLDCANGATYRAAPEIFRRLGADVDAIAAAPDGRNINDGVGLHARRRPRRTGGGGRLRRRLRVRRRRRPRAGRRPQRRGGGRRRADRAGRAAPARRGPPARRRRGGDRDDQLRLPHRHARGGRGGGRDRRSATGTCSPSCCAASGPWAASSRATSSTPRSCPRATASPRRCSRWRRWRGGDLADRDAMEKLPQQLVNVTRGRPRRAGRLQGGAPGHRRWSRRGSRGAAACWCGRPAPSRLVRVMVEAPDEDECREITARLVEVVERELGS